MFSKPQHDIHTAFLTRHGNLLAFFGGCGVLLICLFCAEILCRLKSVSSTLPATPLIFRNNFLVLMDDDPVLGYRLKKNASFEDFVMINGKEEYRVNYYTDIYGRRASAIDDAESRPYSALFFGCSFTFGDGAEQNETMPIQFANNVHSFIPVNLGCPGWGPQNTWLLLQDPNITNTLPRREGLAFYSYITDHLPRLAGDTNIIQEWGKPLPWLELHDGQIKWQGSFRDRSVITYYILKAEPDLHISRFIQCRLSRILAYNNLSLESKERFFFEVMKDSSLRLQKLYPKMKLCIIIWPLNFISIQLRNSFINAGIQVFDYSKMISWTPEANRTYWFSDGRNGSLGHPRPVLYQMVAEQLAQDVKEKYPEYNDSPK